MAGGSPFVIIPDRGAAVLSGTLLDSPYESTMQSVLGASLVFTLVADEWVPTLGESIAQDDSCTGTLISSLRASTAQDLGWQAVVQSTLRSNLQVCALRDSIPVHTTVTCPRHLSITCPYWSVTSPTWASGQAQPN